MNLVFSTDGLPASMRYDAWRSALCDHYVHVDTVSDRSDDYRGFIKEESFGIVTITDTLLSPQTIERRRGHLAHIDKDCFYLALMKFGRQQVGQQRRSLACDPVTAALFCASEPYVLRNDEPYRAIYLEFPRQAFVDRCATGRPPLTASLNTAIGMGRVVAELCTSMVLESDTLRPEIRRRLGEELLNLLAIAIESGPEDTPIGDPVVQAARLRRVKASVEANLGNPLLNPERIAGMNQISVRALHYLFKSTGTSVSDWMWNRRLERCRNELETPTATCKSVTEIALAAGFNSLSHFSTLFRRKYGATPSEIRAAAGAPNRLEPNAEPRCGT